MLKCLLLSACTQDVHIMKTHEDEASVDTSVVESFEIELTELEGISGYVNYYLRQVACPSCVGESQELTVDFTAKFHEPISDSHTKWIPENGNCTNQLLMTVPSTIPVQKGQSIDIEGSFHSFSAVYDGEKYQTSVFETMYDRDALHNINFLDGTDSLEFITSHGFDSIEPYTMLYVDPSYAFAAPIYKNGTTFSWTPNGSDSDFMITLAIYTSDGSQLLGYVACTSPDQGFMTIPANQLDNYPPWSLVAIHLSRHKIKRVPYEPMGSYIETHMEWEVVGTGHIE